jgi:predicted GH43/DUF377 family glycosyl hydrolase
MTSTSILVKRTDVIIRPDQSRVLLRPFAPGDGERIGRIIGRIIAIPESQVNRLLTGVCAEFGERHHQIRAVFLERFEQVRQFLAHSEELPEERKMLIGSYFVAEYSLESAALFNPSIVPHPDQSGLPANALRFVLSLRATGEGHISSITFRTGIISSDNRIEIGPAAKFLTEPRQTPNALYEKLQFKCKLFELGLANEFTGRVMHKMKELFTFEELRSSIDEQLRRPCLVEQLADRTNTADGIWTLAKSNHEVQFKPEQWLSERILFPSTPSQRNGIEDARFVRFQDDDGSFVYYATFTAFDGRLIVPQLVETSDFLRFRFITLNGPGAENKGVAIFPRKINGKYVMLSRQDNENVYLMFSESVYFWHERQLIAKPSFPWELIQLGNCGSPIETEAGWLVLTHGVGPMRKYCIGAFLLDRDDPSKLIGRLREPLLQPNQNEREGYVPNVVYSCGALVHNGDLIIPYAMADYASSFATVPVRDVLAAME